MQTLAVNPGLLPVAVISTKHATIAVTSGRAIILSVYDTIIRSAGCSKSNYSFLKESTNETLILQVPSVIQYTKTQFVPKEFTTVLPLSRKNVYIRDRGHCMYCNKKVSLSEFTFDHVRPQHAGGTTCWENVVVCCTSCNSTKSHRALRHWKDRKLIRQPYAPRLDKAAPTIVVNKIAAEIPCKSWCDYVYWNVILEPICL